MPRYVILEHDHPFLHWDFMLESADVLRTWRLSSPPLAALHIPAELLGDHRIAYLDYEGPVSGNRGTVQRWDAGTFQWEEDLPGRVIVRLSGQRCNGIVLLEESAGEEKKWTFRLSP
jgi:DNA polymerase Ligase (LigD)